MQTPTIEQTTTRRGYSVKGWSTEVGVCVATTWNLIKRGEIETARVGTRRLILTSPAEFLAARRVTPQAAA